MPTFIDVDGLKTRNDSFGHAPENQLLRQVADTIRGHVRSHDLIVRYGGDEFLCGLLDTDIAAVADRFMSVNADLAAIHGASITIGLAAGETAMESWAAARWEQRSALPAAGATPTRAHRREPDGQHYQDLDDGRDATVPGSVVG